MATVSDVKIWPTKGNNTILANGSLVLDSVMEVKFSVIKGPKGPFVGFPGKSAEKDGKKVFYPDVKIIDTEFSGELTKAVMTAYNNKTGKSQGSSPEPARQVADDDIPF